MRCGVLYEFKSNSAHLVTRIAIASLAVLACVLLHTSESLAQTPAIASNAQPQDALVVLQMGACERRCPVYKLVIFADGTTIYEGRHYVARSGVVRGKIPLDTLGTILRDAEALKFHELKKRYVPAVPSADKAISGECLTPKSDAPAAILTIASKGQSSTIVHYRGCSGTDATRLAQFEDRIIAAANIAKLK